jgi:hypothetical protein
MRTRLTRIAVSGFRSLREVELKPRPLQVVLDAHGGATRDLIAVFTLLRELARGQLQRSRGLDGVAGPVTLVLGTNDDDYTVTLRHGPDGIWRVTDEELMLLAGLGLPFVESSTHAPRDEAVLSTFPPEPLPDTGLPKDEASWLGAVGEQAARSLNRFLRGFRVQSAASFDVDVPLLFLEEPDDVDLPSNAAWNRGQAVRAAAARVPVLLCTPSAALADVFDMEDVLLAETSDGTTSFRPR